jgi:pimeloyl-ACP methyl ester carboxylesterase
MTIIWWIVGTIGVLVALKLIIVWAEPYMSFVPRKGATPAPPGFENIAIMASDGARLTGWKTKIPTDGPVFLYFCGNAGNLEDRDELMVRCATSSLAVIAFNYRGTGESEGRATEAAVHRDAIDIYEYAVTTLGVDPGRIVYWGHSIGGAVATELGCNRPPAGIVLEGTFRSGLAMAKRMLPFLPVSWFMTYKLDNEANLGRLNCPVLLVHGSHDFTIPPADSEYLANVAKGNSEVWIVQGADHNDIYEVAGPEFFSRLDQFGQRVTSRTPTLR